MSVKLVIKNPPDTSKLGAVAATVSGTVIYNTPQPIHNSNPVITERAGVVAAANTPLPATIGPTFVRNNRVFGPYSDLTQAKLSLAYLISRENEYGSDV